MMMSRRTYKSVLILSVLAAVLVFQGNGCSGGFKQNSDFGVDLASSGGGGGDVLPGGGEPSPTSDINVIPNTKTVSVAYSKQILNQMTACVGLNRPSDATIAMYETKKGAVSTYGHANSITSPMMMAVVSIAGEVCNDLITQESGATKKIFAGADFSSSNLPSNSVIQDWISRLAFSCWQRGEETTEQSQLMSMISANVQNGEAMANKKAALMLCTSMLSSLDSLLN